MIANAGRVEARLVARIMGSKPGPGNARLASLEAATFRTKRDRCVDGSYRPMVAQTIVRTDTNERYCVPEARTGLAQRFSSDAEREPSPGGTAR
jgi:hypothetical protein